MGHGLFAGDGTTAGDIGPRRRTFDWTSIRSEIPMSTAQNKIAGAPISWGVCEVPGWATSFLRIVS